MDENERTRVAKGSDLAAAEYRLKTLSVFSYGEPTAVIRTEGHRDGVSLHCSDGEVWDVDAHETVILCDPVSPGDRVRMAVAAVDVDENDVERRSEEGAMATVTSVEWQGPKGWSVGLQVDDGPAVFHSSSDDDLDVPGGNGLGFQPVRSRPLTVVWHDDHDVYEHRHIDYDGGDPFEQAVREASADVAVTDEADRAEWVAANLSTLRRVAVFEGHAPVAADLDGPSAPSAPGP